jgi:hypothetical protein
MRSSTSTAPLLLTSGSQHAGTLSVAAALVVLPQPLVITQSYAPASALANVGDGEVGGFGAGDG